MDLAQLAQLALSAGGAVGGWKALELVVTKLGDRRRIREEARKLGAEAAGAEATARVTESAGALAWAQRADVRAEKLEGRVDALNDKLDAALARARAAEDRAEATDGDLAELRRDHDALVEEIRGCQAGTSCPIAAAVIR